MPLPRSILRVGLERQAVLAAVDDDARAGRELTREHALGERVLEVLLDCPLERPRAVLRVPADLGEEVLGPVGELDAELALGEALRELPELDVDDCAELRAVEPVEDQRSRLAG